MIRTSLFTALALSLSLSLSAAESSPSRDFEMGRPIPEQNWSAHSDQIAGGSSYLFVRIEKDGANPFLHISGQVIAMDEGPAGGIIPPFAWAIHYFNAKSLGAADLSRSTALSFRIKGRRQVAEVALFQETSGIVPATQPVQVTPEWTVHRIPLASFGVDIAKLTAMAIGRSSEGDLDVAVDDIQIR